MTAIRYGEHVLDSGISNKGQKQEFYARGEDQAQRLKGLGEQTF